MLKLLIFITLLFIAIKVSANEKQLIGHFFAWNGELQNVNTNDLTHLVYNHLNLTANGDIAVFDEQQNQLHFLQLKKLKAQQANLKVLASIGGWALSQHYPAVVADTKKSQVLVNNIGQFVASSDFDGISIDWRYPGVSRESTVGDRDMDGEYLLRLVKNIKQTYPDMPLIITVSVLPDDLAYLPVARLSQYADFIEVLSLDLAGHWQNHTGHASPLYSSAKNPSIFTSSVNEAVAYLLKAQVPASKIIISVPAFAHSWMGVSSDQNGLFQASKSVPAGDYSFPNQANTGMYQQRSIASFFFKEGYQSYWDDQANASYLFNNENGHFITFESTRSLKAKVQYIHEKNLAGISIQNLDADTSLTAQAAKLLVEKNNLFTSTLNKGLDNQGVYLTVISLLLIIILLVLFYLRLKHLKKVKLTKELINVKQQLQQLTIITENERTTLQQQLAQKQSQYKMKTSNEPISNQLQQMLEHLSKQVQQLSNDPNLLSELHKVTSNKNKILYIQAEKGYTGLYLKNALEPEYIYSRLKQLKLYYNDDFLIQIHRSYLVSSNKIDHISEHSEGKFSVSIGGKVLPVGGSYLARLREKLGEKFT